jgi:NAD(P)-dependent dehydrogenase (short-subunit alcohol dehydrogenase family)
MADNLFDIDLGLKGSHVLVTGSSGAIGSVVTKAFLSAGAYVSAWDIVGPKELFHHERLHSQLVNITDETALEKAMEGATAKFGVVSTLIAVAGVDLSYCATHSLADMPLEEWKRIMNVNVDGTFLTCRAWLRGLRSSAASETKNVAAVIFGSEAGIFGVPSCAPYAASKSAIQYGLVKSLARDVVSIHPSARVNAVAPGPVATAQFIQECEEDPMMQWREAEATLPLRKPVAIEAVARMCLFLASDTFAGNITGQLMPIDSGKSGKLFWLADGTPA